MEERLGVVAVVLSDRQAAAEVQTILSANAEIIVGRMGVPDKARGRSVISLIVCGTVDKISSLTGALGRIEGVQAKSVLTNA